MRDGDDRLRVIPSPVNDEEITARLSEPVTVEESAAADTIELENSSRDGSPARQVSQPHPNLRSPTMATEGDAPSESGSAYKPCLRVAVTYAAPGSQVGP